MCSPAAEPLSLQNAVRLLRQGCGQTQTEFARRLRVSLVTVARWETSRPPSGIRLQKLTALAENLHLQQCVSRFKEAQQNATAERALMRTERLLLEMEERLSRRISALAELIERTAK